MAFSKQVESQPPANISAGVRISTVAFTTDGTNSTSDIISPVANVGAAIPQPVTLTGSRIVLTNTVNSSGIVTLLAASTRAQDVLTHTVLRFAIDNATVVQDFIVTIISKG